MPHLEIARPVVVDRPHRSLPALLNLTPGAFGCVHQRASANPVAVFPVNGVARRAVYGAPRRGPAIHEPASFTERICAAWAEVGGILRRPGESNDPAPLGGAVMADVWEQLSLYESTDLVMRFYHERHGSAPSDEKKHAVAAYMAQGRQYFQSARDASDLVKPLLLFYGANALAKCVILFLNPAPDATDLKPSHGLSQNRWEDELRKGLASLLGIRAKVTDGTFSELVSCTRGTERLHIPVESPHPEYYPDHEAVAKVGIGAFPQKTVLTLRDILSRMPGLARVYERTLNLPANYYRAFVRMHPYHGEYSSTTFMVQRTRFGLPDWPSLSSSLNLSSAFSMTAEIFHETTEDRENIEFSLKDVDPKGTVGQWPSVLADEHGALYVIRPIAQGGAISSLCLLYVASFFTGTLVRYHAPTWLSLVSKGVGDSSFPLLKAAVTRVEREYPYYILAELEDQLPDRPT
jgi:hypothetical protein